MENKKMIPEIRFKGFEDEWEEKKLGDVAAITTGYPFDSDNFNKSGKYLVITNGNIQNASPFVDGLIGNRIDISNNSIYLEYILNLNDILVTMDGTVARTAKVVQKKQILAQRVGRIISKEAPEFIYQSLNTGQFFKEMTFLSHGGTIKHISLGEINSYKSFIPTNIKEQSQIGGFFQNLDSLIGLHQLKYEKLITVKKSMLEKMFPKDGADVPEIRFKGFEGKWEKKTLGEIADIIGGGTPSTLIPGYWNGDIDWYSPTEIGENVYAEYSEKKITELGLQNSSAKILPAGKTILFTSRAGIGDMAILKRKGATNQGFQSLVLKEANDVYFFYSMGFLIKYFAEKFSSGSTFLEISGKMLAKMKTKVPNPDEQTKIGEYFQKMDSLISLQQQELVKLKNIKKACLEKMFV